MSNAEKGRQLIARHPRDSKNNLARRLADAADISFDNAKRIIYALTTPTSNNIQLKASDKYIGPNLRPGIKVDYSPFIVNAKRILILSDIHIPYHNREVINTALSFGKKENVDCIILNGDTMDFYALSDYDKNPLRTGNTWREIRQLIGFLNDLRINFPKAQIIYKFGNHDERYEKILHRNKEFADFGVLDFHHLINVYGANPEEQELARQRNVEIVRAKRIIRAGKLDIVHGHEFGKSVFSPVNPARGFYMRAKTNVIGGHHHQTSAHTEKDMRNNVIGAWSTGCLCDLHPDYMPINKWNHGFAVVYMKPGGDFIVSNRQIVKRQVL